MWLKQKITQLLTAIEKYAQIDVMYLVRGNFWLNINRLLSILNGLALSIAFAHLLTKEDYGVYSFVLVVVGLFSMPHTTALGSGIIKGVPRGNHALIFEGLKIVRPWSFASSVVLAALSGYYFVMGNVVLSISFLAGGLTIPILVHNGVAKSFLSAKGDFGLLTRFNIMRTPIMTAALLASAFVFHNALSIIITSILGNTLLSFFLYKHVNNHYDLKQQVDPQQTFAKPYALHSALLSIVSYLSEKMDTLLLWKFLGAAPVAIYSYALAPVRELRSLIENQGTLAIPKFAQRDFDTVRKSVSLRMKQLYIVTIPLVILYILSAPHIFTYLFPQYTDSVFISQLAALSILAAPRRLMQAAISAHQKIKESYIIILLPNILRLIIVSILIPLYGITGAVIALLVTEFLEYIILGILMHTMDKSV